MVKQLIKLKQIMNSTFKTKCIILTIFVQFFNIQNNNSQIINGSFEEWEGNKPKNWNYNNNLVEVKLFPDGTNSSDGSISSNDRIDGDSALILRNWYFYVPNEISQKVSISSHPLALSGWYKLYASLPNEEGRKASFEIKVFGQNNNIIGSAYELLDTVNQYKPFIIPIIYSENINSIPTSIEIVIKNSTGTWCIENNCNPLYLDKLELIENTTNTENILLNPISIFPNPSQNNITINNISESMNIEIKDIQGRILKKTIGQSKIDISDLLSGIYIFSIYNSDGKLIYHEKVVKKE